MAVTGVQPPNPGGSNGDRLDGVVALSSCDAWAVGSYAVGTADRTLVLRCDRVAGKVVPSPNPGRRRGESVLTAVSAASPASAWAVGWYGSTGPQHTLVLHWNGKAWQHVPSPDVAREINDLGAVSALYARNAWAAGGGSNGGDSGQTLIEHWNGSSWKIVPSAPDPRPALLLTTPPAAPASAARNHRRGTGHRLADSSVLRCHQRSQSIPVTCSYRENFLASQFAFYQSWERSNPCDTRTGASLTAPIAPARLSKAAATI